jgi:hypothetical protein
MKELHMEDAFAVQEESLQSCESPMSFFKLIESVWEGNNDQPLHRFCSLMRKMKARSYVQEYLILNQELQDEKYMLDKYFGTSVNLEATRLTFFCHITESKKWSDENLTGDHILGYAIIVKIHLPDGTIQTHLLEAVVRPPSVVFPSDGGKSYFIEPITNYYLHNAKPFKTCLGTKDNYRPFTIYGAFFTQQNKLTSVCAHACLRMALNSTPFITRTKLTNKEINDILKIPDYKVQDGVLTLEQIQNVIKYIGYNFHGASFSENTMVEYDQFMYPSLESCFPTILGIDWWDHKQDKMVGHVVTVLGHTINSDRWEPEAEIGYGGASLKPYISSAEWCDHYIISDDNYGMYSTLPTDAIRHVKLPKKKAIKPSRHVCMAISIVPDKVSLTGYAAEQFSIYKADQLVNNVAFQTSNKWHDRLKGKNLVCRTLLQTKNEYLTSIYQHTSNFTQAQQECLNSLPDRIWVSEISLPNIYTANKHKLGDVVLRTDMTGEEYLAGKSLAMAWFPGFIQLGNQLNIETWDIKTHVPLIRHAEDSILEW